MLRRPHVWYSWKRVYGNTSFDIHILLTLTFMHHVATYLRVNVFNLYVTDNSVRIHKSFAGKDCITWIPLNEKFQTSGMKLWVQTQFEIGSEIE